MAERVRLAIRAQGSAVGVTASTVIATTTVPLPGAELLARADRAMYEAEQAGRDQVQPH